ncbi:hypothetical protein [Myroides fluvii]|uniref:hypothetical protein n=1 Tax=Myroides fluvii TaxID=2572594 RepID=UPI001E65D00A|nr:hypothetical protein [Myroides fluvii]
MENRLIATKLERKVNSEEIDQLHLFIRKHYVEYYDVELELVDHLANDIERQWQQDQQLSFAIALDRAFKKFGVFGFMDVVEQKINRLSSAYYKESFRLLKGFFTIPKIIFSMALLGVVFVLLRFLGQFKNVSVVEVLEGGVFLFLVFQLVRLFHARRQRQKQMEKKWLLHAVLFHLEIWPYYLLFFLFFRIFLVEGNTTFALVMQTVVITATGLYIYILKAIIIPKINADLNLQKQRITTV